MGRRKVWSRKIRQSIFLVNFGWLAVAASSFISRAHHHYSSPRTRRHIHFEQKKQIMAETSAEAVEASSVATNPNWKSIPRPREDPEYHKETESILGQRGIWSKESFQQALDLYDHFMSCQDSYVAGPIESALSCLNHAFRLYGPESVICSFNGGKDAVVIFHLVRAAHAHFYRSQKRQREDEEKAGTVQPVRPRVIYFEHKHEFPEVLSFLHDTVAAYDLEMLAFEEGTKFAQGLEIVVQKNYPSCLLKLQQNGNNDTVRGLVSLPLAFVLGTRTTDPNAGQQSHFAPSSTYMPPFMRVNPVLEWTYGHVWHFLRLFHLPYCSLYDQGYTSLGTVKDTLPCPDLAVPGSTDDDAIPKYWPAYMLRDWDRERAGRISNEEKEGNRSTKKSFKTVSLLDTQSSRHSSLGRLSTFTDRQFVAKEFGEDETSCVSFSEDGLLQRTVGILIIGDEILKGLTADTNTHAAAAALRNHNVLLKRVVVVSDNLDDIVREIGRLKTEVDAVITSGGVGPTHDDVTIKSVADALGIEMVLHEEMAQLLRAKMSSGGDDTALTEAQTKMATLPDKAKLRYISDDPDEWPVLQCSNIFILPGVPEFFEKKIENVAEYLSCQLERGAAYKVVLSVDENSIVPTLNQVVSNHPNVTFGSYPFVSHPDYKTVITVEGRLMSGVRSNSSVFSKGMLEPLASTTLMDRNVQLALDELINALPEGSVLRVDNGDLNLFD